MRVNYSVYISNVTKRVDQTEITQFGLCFKHLFKTRGTKNKTKRVIQIVKHFKCAPHSDILEGSELSKALDTSFMLIYALIVSLITM